MQKLLTIFLKVPELQRKILMTAMFLAIYRIGFYIPLPIIDQSALEDWKNQISQQAAGKVLGVKPVADGYRQWTVRPDPVDLAWAQGDVPVPGGKISVRWRRGSGNTSFVLTVAAPAKTAGQVAVPLLGHDRAVAMDGTLVWQNGRPVNDVQAHQDGGSIVFDQRPGSTPSPGAGEPAVFTAAILGSSLGFLWFNTYPASVFMGDVGSLPLGAALGTVAVISKHELLLLMVGGVFVIEAVSVIFQVASYKSRGKRIFLMAPIHHHFEMKGWEEPKVVVRLWIIAILLALLSLSTLKLR